MENGGNTEPGGSSLKHLLDQYERQLIERALAAADGNQRRAAAALGVLPTTLHEKMKRLGLRRRTDQARQHMDDDTGNLSAGLN